MVLERDGNDTTVARYTHEGGSLYEDLIAMNRGGSTYQYLFDGLGSVSEVMDSSEATQNSYRYEAFGQIESSTSSVSNPYAYVGAYGVHRDPEPSLYFMQARYYRAGIGRFVSTDPVQGSLQDPPSLHRYLYARNSPVSLIDPSGLVSTLPVAFWEWFQSLPRWLKAAYTALGLTAAYSAYLEWIARDVGKDAEEQEKKWKERFEPAWRIARCGNRTASAILDCTNKCREICRGDKYKISEQRCIRGCGKRGL